MLPAHGAAVAGPRYVDRKAAASELGFTRQRLEKLIKQGRITETRLGIDIDRARAEYASTIDPDKKAVYDAHVAKPPPTAARPSPSPSPRRAEPSPSEPERRRSADEVRDPETGELLDFSRARTRREMANARRAELDYRAKSGLLLSREEVAAKEFAIARKMRDRITGFPARLVNMLPPDAMKELVDECEALCRELQDEVAAIAEATTTN